MNPDCIFCPSEHHEQVTKLSADPLSSFLAFIGVQNAGRTKATGKIVSIERQDIALKPSVGA